MHLDGGCDDGLSPLRRFGEQRMHGGGKIFPQELRETIGIDKKLIPPFSSVDFLSADRTILTGRSGESGGLSILFLRLPVGRRDSKARCKNRSAPSVEEAGSGVIPEDRILGNSFQRWCCADGLCFGHE